MLCRLVLLMLLICLDRSFGRFFLKIEGINMSSLSRELVFLILQFLDEEKFKETVHKYVSLSSIFHVVSFCLLSLL